MEDETITGIATVPLTRIRSEEASYRITTASEIRPLADSIRSVGLLCMPFLLESPADGDGIYRIVSGFRRVEACKRLGYYRIAARVLPPYTPERLAARIAIADNACQRELNLIERARAYALLADVCADRAELSRTALETGLPGSIGIIEKMLSVSRLSETIQNGLLRDTLALPVALELGKMEAEEATAIAELFARLRLSLGKQREVLTLVREIAAREDLTIPSVIADLEPLLGDEADKNHAASQVRKALRGRRYPRLTAAEAEFERVVRELDLGPGVSLQPPRDFEGNTYSLRLDINAVQSLKARRDLIDRLADHPLMQRLLTEGPT